MKRYLIVGIIVAIILLILLFVYLKKRSHRPKYYVLIVTFDDGYYVDLTSDERWLNWQSLKRKKILLLSKLI